MTLTADRTTAAPRTATATRERIDRDWRRALVVTGVAYLLSRAAVIAGAGIAAASEDRRPENAGRPILDALTTWDGNWYFRIARLGYPQSIPSNVTFFDD